MDIKKFCVKSEVTLLECMKNMDATGAGITLAVDKSFRLIGTVSDGDIRKALLNGFTLESPVTPHINRNCFYVKSNVTRAEVLDIMQARRFEQAPILDEERKVIGLHLLHDILGNIPRQNWAIIMAGGKGTRLHPITEIIPKPMIRVAGRPILERIVLHLVSYGIRRIFLSVNHLAQVIEDYFEDGSRFGAEIGYLREHEPLGSGGAISLLPKTPEQPIIVLNGDLIVDINFADMIEFHSKNNFYATMGVSSYIHQVPYGCIDVQNNLLQSIEEKPIIEKMVNAGIYVLSPEAVSAIPDNTNFPITTLFEDGLKNNLICGTFRIEKEWHDIGAPHQLKKARGEVL